MGAILVGGVVFDLQRSRRGHNRRLGLASWARVRCSGAAGGSAHLGRLPCGCTEHMLTLFQTNMGKLYVQADTHNTRSMYS